MPRVTLRPGRDATASAAAAQALAELMASTDLDPADDDRRAVMVDSHERAGLVQRERRVATLLRILVPRDLRTRYRRSAFDLLWAVISPVVMLVVYGLILTKAFGVTSSCGPYLTSAWLGLVVWMFFATSLGGGVYSLISASDLLTKVYFPREALPLATVGATMLDLAVGAVLAVVVLLVQGVRPGITAVAVVVPLLLLLLVWTALLTVLSATVAVFARDTVHVVNLALRVGFFATPVMYESTQLPSAFAWSAKVNPLAVTIDAVRESVLCGRWPDWQLLGVHMAVGVVGLVLVVLLVRGTESRIADVV